MKKGLWLVSAVLGASLALAVGASAAGVPTDSKMKVKAELFEAVLANEASLVKNPSFEPDLEGWRTWGPSGSLAWDISDVALFGDSSATISEAGDYDLLYVNLTEFTPGVDYLGFGWIKTDLKAKNAVIRVVAAGYSKTDSVVQYIYSADVRGVKDWTLAVIKVKPQADVVKIAFQACCLGSWEPDDTAYVDGLTFIRADKLDSGLVAKLLAK